MKILYEDTMPYAEAFFNDLGDARVFSHKSLTPADLIDVDALLVRSTTKVNEALLSQANTLKFVATATAGIDHIDTSLLADRGIEFFGAAGCNAVAVAEYVLSALCVMNRHMENWPAALCNLTVGIVGAGKVGTALSEKLDALGIAYKLCDPPLQHGGDPRPLVDLEALMTCDVITLHTPFVAHGPHPTAGMFDANRLARLSDRQLLINACRGEVLDNAAALELRQRGLGPKLVLDVWETEPDINLALMHAVEIATPHIAGHTIEGKSRGTEMVYQALCGFFGLTANTALADLLPTPENPVVTISDPTVEARVAQLILSVYDVAQDSRNMKSNVKEANDFVYARKHYAIRREFGAFGLKAGNSSSLEALYRLGFSQPT